MMRIFHIYSVSLALSSAHLARRFDAKRERNLTEKKTSIISRVAWREKEHTNKSFDSRCNSWREARRPELSCTLAENRLSLSSSWKRLPDCVIRAAASTLLMLIPLFVVRTATSETGGRPCLPALPLLPSFPLSPCGSGHQLLLPSIRSLLTSPLQPPSRLVLLQIITASNPSCVDPGCTLTENRISPLSSSFSLRICSSKLSLSSRLCTPRAFDLPLTFLCRISSVIAAKGSAAILPPWTCERLLQRFSGARHVSLTDACTSRATAARLMAQGQMRCVYGRMKSGVERRGS